MREVCRCVAVALVVLVLLPTVFASDGRPISSRRPLPDLADSARLELRGLTAEEIALQAAAPRIGTPLRVGHPLSVQVSPGAAGQWDRLENGDRVWRLRIASAGARWLVLGFGVFRPVAGAALWAYNDDRSSLVGPFNRDHEQSHGQLWVGPVFGSALTVELLWPASAGDTTPNIELNTVSHGFRGFDAATEKRLGDSGSCNIDVRCPLGADWTDEKRGVVLILRNGSDHCSGSLINTTARDCRPLLLTAAHCMSSQSSVNSMQWIFNFERSACGSGSGSTDQQIAGGTLRATSGTTDFTLVELPQPVPEAWAPYYNGWSRSSSPATQVTGIHHPSGDAKKISRDNSGTVLGSSWGTTHWRVPSWDQGVTEGGSSGSPLFDQDSRIVGQLHGGESSCSTPTWDEYGRFDLSWTGGGSSSSRLSDWLDPLGTTPPALNGDDYTFCLGPRAELEYRSHQVDDVAGNANGYADPGETITLPVTIGNIGNSTATGVAGTIQTNAVGVTIVDGSAGWPDVNTTTTQRSLAPHFQLQLAATVGCGSAIPLTLDNTATSPAGNWTSNFDLIVGQPVTTTTFEDTMEAGLGQWVSQSLQGTNSWTQTTSDAFSPTHSWAIADVSRRTDSVLLMQTLPNLLPGAELRFMHKYRTENFSDGGVLEYAVGGGGWTDAGPLITAGGYTANIRNNAQSNLAGRSAWAGDSAGWTAVRVDLASLAGQNVQLRWRFATDTVNPSTGWAIDDVRIAATSYSCQPTAGIPGEASAPGMAPLTIGKESGKFRLNWSAPPSGATATNYKLYRFALPLTAATTPTCEADLGSGTTALLTTLSNNQGFVSVARNTAGEGSYGTRSDGTPRAKATGGNVCP